MISVTEASERILSGIQPLPGVTVATGNAHGYVLAESVVAPLTSPPWNNSSMDGYAVRSADLTGGVSLRVIEHVRAGSMPSRDIGGGEAMRVMTGAPVPASADTVIRHEDTDNGRDVVVIRSLRDSGRNIRPAGEDFRKGDVIIDGGQALGVPQLGLLASAGIKSVLVHSKPRVAMITSGDELISLEDFDVSIAGPGIVSSNSITMSASIADAGGIPVDTGIAKDDLSSIRESIESARGADLIISTAGISVGDHDYIREAFVQAGGEIDFWKVRMRPGAPLAFGSLGGVPWIGLSGNPVSAIVSFELFVRPVIRRMLGFSDVFPATVPVRVSHPITLAASLMHFMRVMLTRTDDGAWSAELAGSQSSQVLTALARANALLILPGDKLEIAAGEIHRALPLTGTLDTTAVLRLA